MARLEIPVSRAQAGGNRRLSPERADAIRNDTLRTDSGLQPIIAAQRTMRGPTRLAAPVSWSMR